MCYASHMKTLCLFLAAAAAFAEDRIAIANERYAMEAAAQHREIVRVQPVSHLTPVEEVLHARFLLPPSIVDLDSQILAGNGGANRAQVQSHGTKSRQRASR